MPLVKGVYEIRDAQNRCIGATVDWSDPAKGQQNFMVSELPGNLSTAPQVQDWFNAIVGTLDGAPQTRIGAFFGCYAKATVMSFTKNVQCEFSIVISDYPLE
jgi:hypothetical protein